VKAVYVGSGKHPAGAALHGLTLQVSNAAGTAFSLARTTCGAVLLVGKNCQVWLAFTPPEAGASQGVFAATAADSSQLPSLNLIGNGIAPKPAK